MALFFFVLTRHLDHELSHYVAAILLGAPLRATHFSLWPEFKGGRVVLGAVALSGAPWGGIKRVGPVGHSLVGAAPLIAGSLAVWVIARFLQFDLLGETLSNGNLRRFAWALSQSLATPDFWLWLYLLFAISNVMLPSPADRIYWTPVLVFFGGIIILLAGFDLFPAIPSLAQDAFFSAAAVLVFALTTVVVVDLFFILFIFLLEMLLSLVMRQLIKNSPDQFWKNT